MRLEDLTVEVRDINLTRIGVVRPEELSLRMEDRFNNVGTWTLTLPVEHPMVEPLKEPGAGIIVTGPDGVLLSGPTTKPEFQATPEDQIGMVTFDGVTDTVALADALSWPQPSNSNVSTQTEAHDVRTGPAETLMHQYVNANIGPSAPVARRKANLVLGTNGARGATLTKRPRFPVLGNLLTEIAVTANLGFRIVQVDDTLEFQTYEITDRSAYIRLDVANDTLAGSRLAVSAPTATRVIVAGQGEQVDRTFRQVDTADSIAAEDDWGRRIERFVDQRNTDVASELDQAGLEVLAEEGFTAVAVQAVPVDDSEGTMRYGIDWGLGDLVTVVIGDTEYVSTVTGTLFQISAEGFKVGVILGDAAKFDASAALSGRVSDTARRVSELERNLETTADLAGHVDDVESSLTTLIHQSAPVGSIVMWPTATAPTGWLICDGQTFSATTYPALNTLLGGNTTPNLKQRFPMGAGDNAGIAGSGAALLSTGGSPTAQLTTTELPAHTHTGPSHSHSIASFSTLATVNASGGSGDNGGVSVAQGTASGRFAHDLSVQGGATAASGTGNTGSTGSGAAFSIQNPYLALNFIIKAT